MENKEKKMYDIRFSLNELPRFTVEADNVIDALNEAEKVLEDMSKEEILDRISFALDFYGARVVDAEEI